MGISPLMSMGMRALAANYAALQTTGHNIANANVEGYSRQRVELATATPQFAGSGFYGRGADVETVVRTHNAFLTREAALTGSLAAMDRTRADQLRQLETVFATGEQGLGYATQQFLNAMSDLASRPGDAATRQVVLSRADELARRFADASSRLDAQQRQVREELGTTVSEVNEIAANIARLNQQIAAARGTGQPPNDLLDQRDQLIAKLSERINVTTIAADDGTTGVFIGGGQRLVLGSQAQPLAVRDAKDDPTRAAIVLMDSGQPVEIASSSLGGGRIGGLLRFQNEDLVAAQLQIGQMAAAVAGAVNAQHRLGATLYQPAGSVPAGDMFLIGPPQAVALAGNQRNASGGFVGQVSLAIERPSELMASEYDLVADPAGAPGVWQLTRRSDGLVRSIASGDVVDGMRVTIGPGMPAAGDKYLLQPVTRAASGMAALLRDPRDVAAASPLVATTGAANTGSVQVAALTMVSAAANPQLTATITFTGAGGAYAWDLRDRTTNALVSSGTGTWTPGGVLPKAPDPAINGFELTLSGVPQVGDTVSVERTAVPAANNGNALSLAALRDAVLVGRVRQPDGSLLGGASAVDAYASAIANVGVRVQGADAVAGISASLAASAAQAKSANSGVNLDEEAARLIEFQQSYQAAAKVLQVAQSIFDAVLQAAAR